MLRTIQRGDSVRVRDASDEWHEAVADSAVEGTHRVAHGRVRPSVRTIHDFPVVWVRFDAGRRIPWPAEDVELAG